MNKFLHIVRVGTHEDSFSEKEITPDDRQKHKEHIEPWLSALCQAEHLNLLVGSGLTTAIGELAGVESQSIMAVADLGDIEYAKEVNHAASQNAKSAERGQPNLEDQLRVIGQLIDGLSVIGDDKKEAWEAKQEELLDSLLQDVLSTERGIDLALTNKNCPEKANRIRRCLSGFLLPFISRSAPRERLHVFTTNYDRLIEYGCDLLGVRIMDRFVGSLTPVFRSTRLGIDMHYNPPGIHGEPRYLEGVIKFTKLHGSLDWRATEGPTGYPEVQRRGLPFGASGEHSVANELSNGQLIVYPNAAKDIETLEYPYAELFRDFAAAVCQHNSVLFTYGYGFGDDHVNRVLIDMLSIPSTHLAIISYNDAGGRLCSFLDKVPRESQVTLLVGPHFGDLPTLVDHYLPKAAIDKTTWRMVDLLKRRGIEKHSENEKDLSKKVAKKKAGKKNIEKRAEKGKEPSASSISRGSSG